MKKHLSTIFLVLVFLTGLSLLLYPTASDYWNSFHQTQAIVAYTEAMAGLNDELYKEIWENAGQYNQELARKSNRWRMSEEELAEYNEQLNISGNGEMGYIEIPKIQCSLLIYHGTGEGVLQSAAGHIAGTSLPVGGAGTHCALSGHRGLPSAKLFTHLDQLVEGDTFLLHIMDETLTYEVDQIRIVEPDDISALSIEEGQDLCTLVTCTPYGINTHRMLVRGHRIDNIQEAKEVRVTADAIQIKPVFVAPFVAIPMLLCLVLLLLMI